LRTRHNGSAPRTAHLRKSRDPAVDHRKPVGRARGPRAPTPPPLHAKPPPRRGSLTSGGITSGLSPQRPRVVISRFEPGKICPGVRGLMGTTPVETSTSPPAENEPEKWFVERCPSASSNLKTTAIESTVLPLWFTTTATPLASASIKR